MRIATYQIPIFKTFNNIFAVVLFCLLCSGFAFGQSANSFPNIAPDEFTEKGGSSAWDIGTTVPNLRFNDAFNKKFDLYSKLDKPVIIEIFDIDNAQSIKNKKYLNSFYKQYGIDIISISDTEYVNKLREYTQTHNMTWATIMDDAKTFGKKPFDKAYFAQAPKFIVITPDKNVHAILYSENEIGKLGVMLQQYFAGE